jgi:hypothetical protein
MVLAVANQPVGVVVRIVQKEGTRGSLRYIQQLLSRHASLFQRQLVEYGSLATEDGISRGAPVQGAHIRSR